MPSPRHASYLCWAAYCFWSFISVWFRNWIANCESDFETVESRVVRDDSTGDLTWPSYGHNDDENDSEPPRNNTGPWFEILTSQGSVLLREGPSDHWNVVPPSRSQEGAARFFSAEVKPHFYVRILERTTNIEGEPVVLRVSKPEADLRRPIAELGAVLGFALPLAAVLSGTGGYFIGKRSLSPVGQMAARAQQITAESLGGRT
jgi:hypothetical protein